NKCRWYRALATARQSVCDAFEPVLPPVAPAPTASSWIMTIIHELLAETGLGQPDSGTLVRSGAVRRSASALVHLPLRSLSRDAMPSLRDGVHTDKPSIPKGPQMQRLQK
ncbi:MAG: hypothetical protein QOK09_96, partial [Mycobacterium sp.]|nr:hypothetical protein [Mycobacterium sp.]